MFTKFQTPFSARFARTIIGLLIAAVTVMVWVQTAKAADQDQVGAAKEASMSNSPFIIGHRGACGYRPDHTLESYRLAIEQKADFVEPDLVLTKDGVLICRHDCDLGPSTDVADKFPNRKRVVTLDGERVTGWFAHDFTLAEIKSLRARQPFAFRDQSFDGKLDVPTFDEFLELVATHNADSRAKIGIIPEIKHPTYHATVGLPMEERLLAALEKHGYRDARSACIIQSFEPASLRRLSARTGLRLLQLVGAPEERPADVIAEGGAQTYAHMTSAQGLRDARRYAWGLGVARQFLLPEAVNGRLGPPHRLLADAKAAGLAVLVYTLRDEPQFLAVEYQNDPSRQYRHWMQLEVDGIFTDFPDTARRAFRAAGAVPVR
ncbi:MAG: glycerophosphodiester phosphodiesterase [Planctomycetaceae bacterium]